MLIAFLLLVVLVLALIFVPYFRNRHNQQNSQRFLDRIYRVNGSVVYHRLTNQRSCAFAMSDAGSVLDRQRGETYRVYTAGMIVVYALADQAIINDVIRLFTRGDKISPEDIDLAKRVLFRQDHMMYVPFPYGKKERCGIHYIEFDTVSEEAAAQRLYRALVARSQQ